MKLTDDLMFLGDGLAAMLEIQGHVDLPDHRDREQVNIMIGRIKNLIRDRGEDPSELLEVVGFGS